MALTLSVFFWNIINVMMLVLRITIVQHFVLKQSLFVHQGYICDKFSKNSNIVTYYNIK